MPHALKIPSRLVWKAYEESLEMNLEIECSAGSNLASSHAVDGECKPRTVRNRISRSDRNVRVLEYLNDISNLMGMMVVTYCSSIEPS